MKILLSLVFFLLSVQSVNAQSSLIWSDTFDSHLWNWQEVQNTRFTEPNLPCGNADTPRYEWRSVQTMAELRIESADPCQVVLTPEVEELQNLEDYSVQFTMKIDKAEQERLWILYWHDQDNYLAFRLFNQSIYPEKQVNGQSLWLGHTRFFEFQDGETYFVHLEYRKSERKIRIFLNYVFFDELYEADTHPQISKGVPGLAGGVDHREGSSLTWYDNFEVHALDSPFLLPVFGLKQSEQPWKNDVYDHANMWAPTESTIERWGCALVSAVMALRTHGFVAFPSGEELTPRSLNTWLKQQEDGYIGLGNLNWYALSRLSAELAEKYGTPKLEFQRVMSSEQDKIPWLHEQLRLRLPVILEQPGHFILATGIGNDDKILIEDPFYARKELSSYGNTYLSARLFTPSHTDLSAILLVTAEDVLLRFFSETGEELYPNTWIEKALTDPVAEVSSGPHLRLYEFRQPENMSFSVVPSQSLVRSDTIQIFAYQKDGTLSKRQWLLNDERENAKLTVQYQKENLTQFYSTDSDFSLNSEQLVTWLDTEKIRSPLLLRQILAWQNELLTQGTLLNTESVLRKIRLLLLTTQAAGWIDPAVTLQIIRIFQEIIRERFP